MGVTHDLKTPLALIRAYTEAIEDGIVCDPATQVSATEIIAAKAEQLEGMINDLLEFVQMNSGEWRSRLQRVDLAAFLRSASKGFASDVELLHREFQSEIALPGNPSVFMDERLVLRALGNLVNNAIRYTPNGSTISLAASQADSRGGSAVQIMVSDNGPGIDEADLPHIFEMFYRGTSSRREQGMGMGLAVVKWVVDSHGWSISARSGQGARFCITIPLSP
jgi:signal transduction histidine kinase